jgi:hypothetical protein
MAVQTAPAYVADARKMDLRQLVAKYRHEAGEHRRILFCRGSGLDQRWRDFRQFLADMGPAPDTDHLVTRTVAGSLTYAPGKCAWIHRDRQPAATSAPAIEPTPVATVGIWANVQGKPVEYAALAKRLGVPFEGMVVALRSGQTPDGLVQQASITENLVRGVPGSATWLPPEHEKREAFVAAYRMWHMQVRPKYATAATPAFLYLYSALPGMRKTRDALKALDLWDPATEQGRRERSVHDLWRRFCESMMKVDAARTGFAIYEQYSLTTELDELWTRVRYAEERFRTEPA